MKVFIVMACYNYDGDEIAGVYLSRQAAECRVTDLEAQRMRYRLRAEQPDEDFALAGSFIIEEHEAT